MQIVSDRATSRGNPAANRIRPKTALLIPLVLNRQTTNQPNHEARLPKRMSVQDAKAAGFFRGRFEPAGISPRPAGVVPKGVNMRWIYTDDTTTGLVSRDYVLDLLLVAERLGRKVTRHGRTLRFWEYTGPDGEPIAPFYLSLARKRSHDRAEGKA